MVMDGGQGLRVRALGRRGDQAQAVSSLARTCTGTRVDGRARPPGPGARGRGEREAPARPVGTARLAVCSSGLARTTS